MKSFGVHELFLVKIPINYFPAIFVFAMSLCAFPVEGFSKIREFEPLLEKELNVKEPQIDPEADVEYLYREILVRDRGYSRARHQETYNRLKIFRENGVRKLDVIHLPYEKGESKITEFRARVTNPNGEVYELTESDLYERTILESRNFKGNAKSFSLPHLQIGSIVEYVWIEVFEYGASHSVFLYLEEVWPTWNLRMEVFYNKLYSSTSRAFNCDLKSEKTEDETYLSIIENLPAWKREPYSPSGLDYRPWLFVYYFYDYELLDSQAYWDYEAEHLWERTEKYLRPKQGAVKALSKRLFSDVKSDEEKLRLAYRFCTEEIENVYAASADYTSEERKKLKDTDSPKETIKRGYGWPLDVNYLFGSLAIAAGYDARIARASDLEYMRFQPSLLSLRSSFPQEVVAVRRNDEDQWRFFDPGHNYLPFGVLSAGSVSVAALVADKKEAKPVQTQAIGSEFSVIDRKAKLELNSFGDLNGEVSISYTGYAGIKQKEAYDELTEEEREDIYLGELKNTFPDCRISDFSMEGILTRGQPLVVSYSIEVPAYGEGLGKRIFFQPNFFEYGSGPLFTEEERMTNIQFPYLWEETDEIWIEFPEGFTPEEATSPGPHYDSQAFEYATLYGLNPSQTLLRCTRDLKVKTRGFLSNGYPTVKALFEDVNRQDTHVITLTNKND